jgi:O-antigen/teichoic acid export membrane protein
MITRIIHFIKRPTSIQIIVNAIGNYLNVVFTAFFAFLLVRILNPIDYGVLSVLLGIAYVLANILDFGITATIYSYLPTIYQESQTKLYRFLKTTFIFQSGFSLIVIILLFIFFPTLDKLFFKTQAYWWELYLTIFSVLFFIWQNYAINALIAAKKVFQANFFLNLSNLIKTAAIFILIKLKLINIASIIFVFGILGPVIFFLFLFFDKKHVFFNVIKAPIKKEEFRFGFTFTFFIASQFFNLGTRMDLFLLSFYFPKTEIIGYYGLASKIILTLFAAVISITQVLSPEFAKISDSKEITLLIKKSFIYLLIPTGLFLLLFVTPKIIFQLAFTEKYTTTVDITHALSLAYIIYPIINIPQLFFLYTKKKPQYLLISNIIFFLSVTVLGAFLIPINKIYGGPLSIFLSFLFSGGFLFFLFFREIFFSNFNK